MSYTIFELDGDDGDYASVLSALGTTTGAKSTQPPTYVQVVRDADHDATIKLVTADITDAERTGSLAPLAKASRGTGVFVNEYPSDTAKARQVFNQLGETGRTNLFVRPRFTQASAGAAPSEYTGGDGSDFANAVAGPDSLSYWTRIRLDANPSNAQTIIINGTTWTFVTSGATGNQTNIQGSVSDTITQFLDDLNQSADANVDDARYTKNTVSTEFFAYAKALGSGGSTFDITAGTASMTIRDATRMTNSSTAIGAYSAETTQLVLSGKHFCPTDIYTNVTLARVPMKSGTNASNTFDVYYESPNDGFEDQAILNGGLTLAGAPTDNEDGTWTIPGGMLSNTVIYWHADFGFAGHRGEGQLLEQVASQSECASTNWSYYAPSGFASGNDVIVNIDNDSDPRYRVTQALGGYRMDTQEFQDKYINIYNEHLIGIEGTRHLNRPGVRDCSWFKWRRVWPADDGFHFGIQMNLGANYDTQAAENLLAEDGYLQGGNAGMYWRGTSADPINKVTWRRNEIVDTGGFKPVDGGADGHAQGIETVGDDFLIEDCVLTRSGGHFNLYKHTDDTANNITIDGLIINGGHSEFFGFAESATQGVAFHLAGDNDTAARNANMTVTGLDVDCAASTANQDSVKKAIRLHWTGNEGLGADPLATTDASADVDVTWTDHVLVAGSYVNFDGATAFNNVTIDGVYVVKSVTDTDTFVITAATTADATGAGGGSLVDCYDVPNFIAPTARNWRETCIAAARSGVGVPANNNSAALCTAFRMRNHDFGVAETTVLKYIDIVSSSGALGAGMIIDLDLGTYRGDDHAAAFSTSRTGDDDFAAWQAESGVGTFDPSSSLVAA